MGFPIWGLALIAAALAPLLVRVIADRIASRAQRRTEGALAAARGPSDRS